MEQCTFSVKGKTYTTEPLNVGRFVDLWKLRSTLSGGTYGNLVRFALEGSETALNVIDISAFLTVFCPDFISDLKPGTVADMGAADYVELEQVYIEQVRPWLIKVEALLKKKTDE